MSNQQPFYLGFDTLEAFAHHLSDEQKPVYLTLTRITQVETPFSNGRYTYRITAAQIQGNHVHYWLRDVAIANFSGGEIITAHQDRCKTAESAVAVVRAFLKEGGVTLIPAVLAMPEGVRLMEGGADCMGYDTETKLFFLKPDHAQTSCRPRSDAPPPQPPPCG